MSKRLRSALEKQFDFGTWYERYPADEFPPRKVVTGTGVLPNVIIGGRQYLQFSSLDYLGLATDPRVVEAAKEALDIYGVGALASRIADGTLDVHEELESAIAEFVQTEAAVVFTAGTLANIGTIVGTLASRLPLLLGMPPRAKKAYFIDEQSHESIRLGLEISKSRGVPAYKYEHNNSDHLANLLERHPCDAKMIVTDGVFSMGGDVAPLSTLAHLAEQYDAILYVDDAHGVGVLGENGRGTCELLGVEDDVDIRIGVLSKAFGVLGGYVAGPRWFIDLVRLTETQIFTMAVPAAEAAASIEAIRISKDEPWRRKRVMELAAYLRHGLNELGFDTMSSSTHIVPVLIGDERESGKVVDHLMKKGIVTTSYESPAVHVGQARLRLFPTASHTKENIDQLLAALSTYPRKRGTSQQEGTTTYTSESCTTRVLVDV